MNKGCLVALAIVGAIAVAGVIGVTVVFKKAKGVVEDLATGVGVSPEVVENVRTLNEDYDFQAPADNTINEHQVRKFIAIKQDFAAGIKKHQQAFEELEDRAGEDAGLAEVAESYKILANIRRDFLQSLRDNEMSPREYMFLTGQVYGGYLTSAAKAGAEQVRAGMQQAQASYKKQYEELDRQLRDPDISDEVKAGLTQARKSLEAAMTAMETSDVNLPATDRAVPPENARLLDKYRTELLRLDTAGFEYWGLATMTY